MQKVREDILLFERELLHVLGFDFHVDHPHGYIMRWLILELESLVISIVLILALRRFARFFDACKRDKESRTLVVSSGEEDRFTELGLRVSLSTCRITALYRPVNIVFRLLQLLMQWRTTLHQQRSEFSSSLLPSRPCASVLH
jgi:hypothetical protein